MTRFALFRAAIAAATLLAPIAGPARAAALRISPIGVDMPASDRASAITIVNTDAEPVSLQIRVFRWSQTADGEEQLDPASDMQVSPPAITVPAGASYTIRVARPAAAPVDTELSYRLLIDELPRPIDPRAVGQGVKMVLRTSLPVFVVDSRAVADLKWTVWQDADGIHAQAANVGKRHAKIVGLALTPAGRAPVSFGEGLNGYVLAGATKRFTLPAAPGTALPLLAAGSAVALSATNEALDIHATVVVGAR